MPGHQKTRLTLQNTPDSLLFMGLYHALQFFPWPNCSFYLFFIREFSTKSLNPHTSKSIDQIRERNFVIIEHRLQNQSNKPAHQNWRKRRWCWGEKLKKKWKRTRRVSGWLKLITLVSEIWIEKIEETKWGNLVEEEPTPENRRKKETGNLCNLNGILKLNPTFFPTT